MENSQHNFGTNLNDDMLKLLLSPSKQKECSSNSNGDLGIVCELIFVS